MIGFCGMREAWAYALRNSEKCGAGDLARATRMRSSGRGEPEVSSADYEANSEDVPPPFDQLWWDWTAARRMCAGTYLDSEFRDRLLREIYNARSRRVAPSYGYDVVPVLTHAWRAWRLEMMQHAVVLLIFLFTLIAFPLDAIIAASILALIHFVHRLVRLANRLLCILPRA